VAIEVRDLRFAGLDGAHIYAKLGIRLRTQLASRRGDGEGSRHGPP
jgi:hypothetical protein